MGSLLTKTEKKIRIRTAKRKKYIEQKLVPQTWLFKKINQAMLWMEKVWRNSEVKNLSIGNYGRSQT